MPNLDEIFADFSADKLKQLSSRIEDCLAKLTDEQIWTRESDNGNAAGNLVLHLCGNVRQWIGTGVGGAPDIRDRDSEFAARGDKSTSELTELLAKTVDEALPVLRSLNADRLAELITVQGYRVTVLEAVYHVVEHFAEHTGQIVLITKMATSADLGFYRHLSGNANTTRPADKP
jgi:uncharacterized damage-inducible protein DinB